MSDSVTSTKQRNSSIEILRFLFMFFIVLIHVYGHGLHLDFEKIYSWGDSWHTAPHLALFALGKVGVTGFMFISGYFGIRMNAKKWITLLGTTFFYFILLSKGSDLRGFLHPYDYWWYISCYLIICLLSPILNLGFKNLDKKTLSLILTGLLTYNYLGSFFGESNSHDVILLLTIYIAARYAAIYQPLEQTYSNIVIETIKKWTNKHLGICLLLVTLAIAGVPILEKNCGIPYKFFNMTVSNNNILLLVFAFLLVTITEKHPFYSMIINKTSSSVLAIYLITDFPTAREYIVPKLLPHVLSWFGYFYILLLCVACILFDKIRHILFEKILFKRILKI